MGRNPATTEEKKEDLERIICNGCRNCNVKMNKGKYSATCEKHGDLLSVKRGSMVLFLNKEIKCKDRK